MLRMSFFFFMIIFRNMLCLLLSSDLLSIYGMGFNLAFMFTLQIICGCLLSWMFFSSFIYDNWFYVLFIMLDFDLGFMISSCHIVFTSCIFMLMYIHLLKCCFLILLFDSSFIVWFCGFLIFFMVILIAFIGYVLPCTSMSYWGLTVFSNMLSTLPIIGMWLCLWMWCGEFMNDYTLLKMHSIHMFLPFMLMLFILLHFFCLHYFMSSDSFYDRFSFYYESSYFFMLYVFSDLLLLLFISLFFMFLIIMKWYFVFHEESWFICDMLKTSDKILPEWFFLVFFGFLKSMPDKFLGLFLLIMMIMFFILFMLNLMLWFYYCKVSYLWLSYSFILFLFLYQMSMLSLYVMLCYPIWMELQFWVYLIFCWLIFRFF